MTDIHRCIVFSTNRLGPSNEWKGWKTQTQINKWYKQYAKIDVLALQLPARELGFPTTLEKGLPTLRTQSDISSTPYSPLSPRPQPQNAKWHCILKSVRTWQAAGSLFSVNPLATSNPALTLDNVFFSLDIIMAGNVLSSFLCLAVLNTWTLTGNRTGVHLACVYGHFKCL